MKENKTMYLEERIKRLEYRQACLVELLDRPSWLRFVLEKDLNVKQVKEIGIVMAQADHFLKDGSLMDAEDFENWLLPSVPRKSQPQIYNFVKSMFISFAADLAWIDLYDHYQKDFNLPNRITPGEVCNG